MTSSKDLFELEQQGITSTPAKQTRKSLFNIRQEHLSLLTEIEDNEGELTEEILAKLQLSQEDFQSKVISYGFVIKKLDAESDVIAAEIKRLQSLKSKADKRADLFRKIIDEGMKQFGYDKVESELLKISYHKSSPVELLENFSDNILQYVKVNFNINPELADKAAEAGITEDVLSVFNVIPSASKERIKDQLKAGIKIPGASIEEKKSLQIR
ncbi:siphovirus Gp157 family protein [Chitinophaga pinensis]|uniref:Uncharacterized protein n=1 Tax=Chitinophaga pinensis (strain ATCC 43595 / DSM 2588 / LMG 13176 / NBRC 15968 / NCIMB 11800 / UQM 2034) TaxID=485918 RepID=A0A979G5N3_CHIPD|nr:siphovirus Gp157 family protein [Chitinophaga pinensis]ACU61320.1 hypothetical protein Cpin_3858 [Chitinophaga pinensis DSM 2588]